ncbi:MAG: uroporphyrinogen-III synthase, partial [Bosea sp. (in: a-proteobacteria)]|nr:uroporphyrinogen-III synthase [Bosea sp. (in: a-proteobacteria)]
VGRDRHDDVGDRLVQAGFSVAVWTAYAAEAVAILPEQAREALEQGTVEGALHYSARGVRTCLELARAAGVLEPLLDLTHVALSADVAAPLITAGASTVLVAEHPEEAALLAALDQVSARNRRGEDATQGDVAPSGVETDKDAMKDSVTPDGKAAGPSDQKPESAGTRKGKGGRSGRTPPTIEATATEVTPTAPESAAPVETSQPVEARPVAVDHAPQASEPGSDVPPEAVLPTEALPREYPGATNAEPAAAAEALRQKPEPAVVAAAAPAAAPSRLPSLLLAGLVGGAVGAGLVMLVMSRTTPAVSPEQIAQLQGRLDTLQSAAAELDRKAAAASDAAAKAGAAAQGATARANEVASARGPDAAALAELNAQAKRAEAAVAAVGQQLERAGARIGSVETLAKAAAGPSPEGLAAARIVLAERVRNALASGRPFAADV